MPVPRRRIDGLEVIARVAKRGDSDVWMDFQTLLEGLAAAPLDPNNHLAPDPGADYPDAYQAPFDQARLWLQLRDDTLVVRLLDVHLPLITKARVAGYEACRLGAYRRLISSTVRGSSIG